MKGHLVLLRFSRAMIILFLLVTPILGVIIPWMAETKAEENPRLAILPFMVERIENPARGAEICPLCKGIYRYGEIAPGSQKILTQLLYAKIESLERFKVFPLEKVEGILSTSAMKQLEEKPIPSAIQIGKELNADFILVDYLFRFDERVGSAIGVERPASVAFDLHLIRLRDGKMVWIGKFDETQRPLSENLFKIDSFLRRKARWLTAEELAGVGLDEMFRKLPATQELEEK